MENMKQALIEAGKNMLGRGLTVETWGNISLRDPQTGYIYLTPSGMNYSLLTEEDVVVFDAAGHHMEGGRRPTIEKDNAPTISTPLPAYLKYLFRFLLWLRNLSVIL